MTATELKNFWRRSPFEPFEIVVPGRSKLHVPHPDFLTVSPTGRTPYVWMKNGDYAVLDVFLITGLEKRTHATARAGAGRESDSVQNPLLAFRQPVDQP